MHIDEDANTPNNVIDSCGSDSAEELIGYYTLGLVPFDAWATKDLIALANAIDDELFSREVPQATT